MEIQFDISASDKELLMLKELQRANDNLDVQLAGCSGSGSVVDDLVELYEIATAIHGTLAQLIRSTIAFLVSCSAQMQDADQIAADKIWKGE